MEPLRARLYDNILAEQIQSHRQMAFITGPRQIGKTTTCRNIGKKYLNWDNQDDRNILLARTWTPIEIICFPRGI
jgi:predicted AAA+ superfamily ATPase